MKHVKYAEKAVLVGDEAADALMDFARMIAHTGGAETVTLRVIGPDGNTVDASFLLTANTGLMSESTNTRVEAPDNDEVVRRMRARVVAENQPVAAELESPWRGGPGTFDVF